MPRGAAPGQTINAAIATRSERLVLMAFDLLHLDGRDLRQAPLEERRGLLDAADPARPDSFYRGPRRWRGAVRRDRSDGGVVSKNGNRYRSGASKTWLKAKCFYEKLLTLMALSAVTRCPSRCWPTRLTWAWSMRPRHGDVAAKDRDRFWDTAEALPTKLPAVPMMPREEATWTKRAFRVRVGASRREEMFRHATVPGIEDMDMLVS